jgi:HK97 family phage portal protein
MPSDEPFNSAWSVETKAFLTSQNLKALFFSEDWVFICVDAYAQPISSLPLQVVRKTSEDGQAVEKPVQFHPVSQLLENPNQFVDGVALKYSLACDYVLGGNSFLYHAKQNKQAYHISFDRVQYKLDGNGLPESYIVYPDNEEIIPNVTKGITIQLSEMVHVRRPNPSSPIWGLSPFVPGRRSVLFNRYSQDYLNSFYLKGATPQGILEMEQSANEQSVLRLLRSFELAHTGRRNQRRTMLLPKGVKWSAADHKIADQQITELVRMNRETILNTLHIPKHVVSLQEAGSLGSEEHKMALKYFWTAALLPTANALAASLTKHFRQAGMLAVNEELRFDTSEVAILQDDLKANAETANLLLQTHTLNEVRAQVFGLPPLPEGDYTPGVAQPLPTLGLTSAEPMPQPELPKLEVIEAVEPQPVPEEQPAQVEMPQTKELGRYASQVKANEDSLDAYLKKELPTVTEAALDFLALEAETAVKTLRSSKGIKADLPSAKEYKKRLDKALKSLQKQYNEKFDEPLEASMSLGYDLQANMIFDKPSRDALLAAKQTDAKGRAAALEARNIETFKNVSKTTTDRVMKIVQKGIEDGLSVDDVAKLIVEDSIKIGASRAQTIARTETLTAVSLGQASMMELAAKAIPGLKKSWITSQDEDVRESHRAVNGEIRDTDEKFSNGLMYPRDPDGDAASNVNCRCVLVTLAPEDLEDYRAELEALKENAE